MLARCEDKWKIDVDFDVLIEGLDLWNAVRCASSWIDINSQTDSLISFSVVLILRASLIAVCDYLKAWNCNTWKTCSASKLCNLKAFTSYSTWPAKQHQSERVLGKVFLFIRVSKLSVFKQRFSWMSPMWMSQKASKLDGSWLTGSGLTTETVRIMLLCLARCFKNRVEGNRWRNERKLLSQPVFPVSSPLLTFTVFLSFLVALISSETLSLDLPAGKNYSHW